MRKYRPDIGRWMSRDSIGEDFSGGYLFVFCNNASINVIDILGDVPLQWTTIIELPIIPILESENPCGSDEIMAISSDYHYVGSSHFKERLPWNRGDINLFNYIEFQLSCSDDEVAFDARFAESPYNSTLYPGLFQKANVAHAPGSPSYFPGGGMIRGSIQSRALFGIDSTQAPLEVLKSLMKVIVVCYKCRCQNEESN